MVSTAAVLAVLSACAPSLTAKARSQFSTAYTCPTERIAITPRPDIRGHTVIVYDEPPPADVAGDPTRLALWNKRHDAQRADADDRTVYQLAGCGHEETYACRLDEDSEGGSSADCQDGAYVRAEKDSAAVEQSLRADVEKARADAQVQKEKLSHEADDARGTAMIAAAVAGGGTIPRLDIALGDAGGTGASVLRVTPGGAADGKLATGDVITSVNGIAVTDAVGFLPAIVHHTRGTSLVLTIRRGDATRTVVLDLSP